MEHGEVAAVDHPPPESAGPLDKGAEVRIELGRTAGHVEELHPWASLEQLQHPFNAAPIEHLRTLGPRLHVTVVAGQVALEADVELQSAHLAPPQERMTGPGQVRVEVGLDHLSTHNTPPPGLRRGGG